MKICGVEVEWVAACGLERTHLQVQNTPVYPECVQTSQVRIDGAGAAGGVCNYVVITFSERE